MHRNVEGKNIAKAESQTAVAVASRVATVADVDPNELTWSVEHGLLYVAAHPRGAYERPPHT